MAQGLQVVFQTRYSFFGSSGWRSDASKNAEELFESERLARRFELFRAMNLASLRDQTDDDFRLLVLTSTLMPADHLKLLTEACHDTLGADRCHVLARAPGSAGRWLRHHMRTELGGVSHAAQIVLDDDDAVSVDFTESVRREATHAVQAMGPGQDCLYLSYATGMTALFNTDGSIDLMDRVVPFTNLGLTLVAPTATRKNPFMLAHKKVARRHDVRVFYDRRPWYLRAVHDTNDSRGLHENNPLPAPRIEAAMARFPLLRDLDLAALRSSAVRQAAE